MGDSRDRGPGGATPGTQGDCGRLRLVEDVIPIDAPNAFLCILGEHLYLDRRFGRGQWQPCRVVTYEADGHAFDRYDLWFDSARSRTIWFDVTASVARWAPERLAQVGGEVEDDEIPSTAPILGGQETLAEGAPMTPAPTPPLILEVAHGSHDGRLHFGEVIDLLVQAGVESYHADYRAHRTTYYLTGGATFTVDMKTPDLLIADAFDAEGVRSAIKGAQQGSVMYPEFKRLTMQAGCVGYVVWILGRQVSYFGRLGEVHMEVFPN